MLKPSIRNLGKAKVKELVSKILNQYEENRESDSELASEYGLSKSTYSRFAGHDWNKEKGIDRIPDLWKNIALVIASNERFFEAAVTFGIGDSIKQILDNSQHGGGINE